MSASQRPESTKPVKKPSIRRFLQMKRDGEKIAVLTAYDLLFSRLLEGSGIDLILVGDSLGEVALGYPSTLPVTLEEMIHHAKAVRRGARSTFLVLDMPFLSYQVSTAEAVRNAGRALKEAEVEAVKVEGGGPRVLDAIRAMTESGIPVMGHIGLTPQSVHALGGYRVQGKGADDAERLHAEARALQEAGCFSMVIELVPEEVARAISAELEIPTIGIGSGSGCDGQVLVLPDMLGLNDGFAPRFLKRFAQVGDAARAGVAEYIRQVKAGEYPDADHAWSVDE